MLECTLASIRITALEAVMGAHVVTVNKVWALTLNSRAAWHTSDNLPIIEGTLIRLEVARLPSGATPKPVWLWWSHVDATAADVNRLWQTFLRRFDIEHTFRMLKQTLGWTAPKIRSPQQADRWTWLILAAYTQLRLAAA
jgi:hypothetical protein